MVERASKPERILRLPAVEETTGLKHSAIYDGVGKGTFPKPIPLTGRAVGWLESEILEWQRKRIALREAA